MYTQAHTTTGRNQYANCPKCGGTGSVKNLDTAILCSICEGIGVVPTLEQILSR